MKPNSNMVITNFSVDKTTQELTSVEINGKSFSLEPAPSGSVTLYAYNENDPEGEGLVTPENMLYADASSLSSATYLISILEKEGTGSDMIKNYLNKGSVSEGLQLYRWPDYDITL